MRDSIFISYSHKDRKYLDELHLHLAHYVREVSTVYWDDTKILPGGRWNDELKNALKTARIAIFLVSVNFFASDFIIKREMIPLLQAAQKGEVKIISVIVGACAFKDSELSKFQSMNAPSVPLNQMPRGKRDKIWAKAAQFCSEVLAGK